MDNDPLIPSIGEINRRLTINAREERRLRTLLKLAFEARDDIERFGDKPPTVPPSGLSRYRKGGGKA
jgi:hypothetical protein